MGEELFYSGTQDLLTAKDAKVRERKRRVLATDYTDFHG